MQLILFRGKRKKLDWFSSIDRILILYGTVRNIGLLSPMKMEIPGAWDPLVAETLWKMLSHKADLGPRGWKTIWCKVVSHRWWEHIFVRKMFQHTRNWNCGKWRLRFSFSAENEATAKIKCCRKLLHTIISSTNPPKWHMQKIVVQKQIMFCMFHLGEF